eukprot:scaffold16206_cov122-Skeletonema_dohrnii-CCMP3373.AAC.1
MTYLTLECSHDEGRTKQPQNQHRKVPTIPLRSLVVPVIKITGNTCAALTNSKYKSSLQLKLCVL